MGNVIRKYRFLLILILFILVGCQKSLDFEEDGPFVVSTYHILGPDDYRYFYDRVIAVHSDGKVELYTNEDEKLQIEQDAPRFETTVEQEKIEELKQLIEENRIWNLREDLTDWDSVDGGAGYITINLSDDSKTIGGQNPRDESFIEVFNTISDLVEDEDYSNWTEKMVEYIFEKNPD